MNQTFLAAVRNHGGPGATIRTAAGTIPAHARPPAERSEHVTGSTMSLASAESRPAQAPRTSVQVASAEAPAASAASSATCSDPRAKTRAPPSGARKSANPHPRRKLRNGGGQAGAGRITGSGQAQIRAAAGSAPEIRPAAGSVAHGHCLCAAAASIQRQEAGAETEAKPASTLGVLNGAAPTVPAGGFEGRFGPWR